MTDKCFASLPGVDACSAPVATPCRRATCSVDSVAFANKGGGCGELTMHAGL
jgi:hypothetical protein